VILSSGTVADMVIVPVYFSFDATRELATHLGFPSANTACSLQASVLWMIAN
jgi:hypothetical protein